MKEMFHTSKTFKKNALNTVFAAGILGEILAGFSMFESKLVRMEYDQNKEDLRYMNDHSSVTFVPGREYVLSQMDDEVETLERNKNIGYSAIGLMLPGIVVFAIQEGRELKRGIR